MFFYRTRATRLVSSQRLVLRQHTNPAVQPPPEIGLPPCGFPMSLPVPLPTDESGPPERERPTRTTQCHGLPVVVWGIDHGRRGGVLHVAPGSVFRVEGRVGKFGLRRSGVSGFFGSSSFLCTMGAREGG